MSQLKKIKNLYMSKNSLNIFYIFFLISLLLSFVAILFHPFVGDDYYYKELVLAETNFQSYFVERYNNWTGRLSQIILSFWVFSSTTNLVIFKILLLPLLLLTFNFFLKKIINLNINFFSENFIILFICFWFFFPAIDEIIFWTSGSIAYLFPFFFAIFYLGLFNEKDKLENKGFFNKTFYIIISFFAGSSHLQVFTGCLVVSSYYIYLYYKENIVKFYKLRIFYFLFLLGGIFLILAPGNFNRLTSLETFSLISTIYKSILFIFTSIFYLGDVQSSLIYILIIILLFFLFTTNFSVKLFFNKSNYIWLIAFLFSLLSVIPAINTISTRLIFFPIFFISVFFLKSIFYKYNFNKEINLKRVALYFLIILFFLECLVGSLTNYVYKKENDKRMQLIYEGNEKSKEYVYLPHYTIIPSRLTYIQTPEHDKTFLNAISDMYNIKFKYDDSLPRSKNIRKDIKFFLDKLVF